jgi:GNAT superfamily N-acetyltransferase
MNVLPTLEIRRSTGDDLAAILALLRESLGWAEDERHERLFTWKHRDNPFGASVAWLGFDGEQLVGVRMLMPWEFVRAGRVHRAARAVDTATHSRYRGRGIFTALTLRAIEDLGARSVDFVFNTPNDQSRPGYLAMGWQVVGRLPVAVRPISVPGFIRMLRARTPAARWSVATSAGVPAAEIIAQRPAIEALLESQIPSTTMVTRLTPEYLAWRYASTPIEYRALAARDGPQRGLAFFRVRRRGAGRELVLCDVLVAGDDKRLERELVGAVVDAADADYAIAVERRTASRAGLIRLPGQGPVLTARAIGSEQPLPLRDWGLRLGDVELF